LHVHVTRLHWLLLSDVCGRTSLLVSGDLMPSSTCKVHYCWILQRRFFKCPAVPAVHGSSSKVKETLLIHFLWRKKLIQLVMIVQAFSRYSHLVRYSTNMAHSGRVCVPSQPHVPKDSKPACTSRRSPCSWTAWWTCQEMTALILSGIVLLYGFLSTAFRKKWVIAIFILEFLNRK
jgi:hypothetical protein